MGFLARCGFAALFLGVLVSAFPPTAAAHLYLVKSEPADGSELGAIPREIRLTFSEPIELAFTQVELLRPDGGSVSVSEPSVSAGEPNVLVVLIEKMAGPGPYSVVWRTASADGHPVRGHFGFSVDEDAEGLVAAAADEAPAVSPVHHDRTAFPEDGGFTAGSPGYVAVRWFTFIGLLGVIGIVAFKLLVLGRLRRGRTSEGLALLGPATARSAQIGLLFGILLALAVMARLYAQSLALHGPAESLNRAAISTMLMRTTWGLGLLLQAAGTLVVLVGFWIARQRSRLHLPQPVGAEDGPYRAAPARAIQPENTEAAYGGGAWTAGPATDVAADEMTSVGSAPRGHGGDTGMNAGWVLASIGAVVLAFTPALGGHAVSVSEYAALAALSDGLHVLGAGGWLGSLLAVLAVGIPVAMRRGKEKRGQAVAVLVHAFSPTALIFAGLVTATGLLSAAFHLGSFADLWQSTYGRTLLLKLGVLSLVFGTGAYNWLRVQPALGDDDEGPRRLRGSAGFELAVGAAVLLVTAVLVATPPPMEMQAAAEHAVSEASP